MFKFCKLHVAGSSSESQIREPNVKTEAEIISQDQGGQEFDPLADKQPGADEPEAAQNKPSKDKEEVVETDQGGQDFEPLEVTRAADWSKQ